MAESRHDDSTPRLVGTMNSFYIPRKTAAGCSSASVRLLMELVVPIAFLLASASSVMGAPVISCHCFQDRSFDPAEPRRIEPYLLATARNSFLAVAFGQSKKEIVRLRMSGTADTDLWVAYYLASKAGVPALELLQLRAGAESWRPVLAARKIDAERTGSLFGRVLATDDNDQALANAAADETLGSVDRVSQDDLRQLRQRGAATDEIILALLIAQRLNRPAIAIHAEVQAGRATWGGLIDSIGIQPGEMEGAVKTLLR